MQNFMKLDRKKQSAGDMLRFLRKLKNMSQLDLALDAGISTRHLSFIENDRSRASRDLILRLAQVLKLPFRHRNALLNASGFAPEFGEEPFSGPKMDIVRQALKRMLDKHEPYPAFVVNSAYQILMANCGFDRIIKYYLGANALKKFDNAYRLIFAEDGLRQYIKDWPAIEQFSLSRLYEDVVATQSDELIALYEEMSKLRSDKDDGEVALDDNLPILSLTLQKGSVKACFFTTITTLGTPLDLTTQELRIELLFPSDEETRGLMHQMA